jgi:hypothetical protein
MGNVQTLANGNAFVGWGDVPFFSEFNRSGQLIFDAVMPTPDISYRAYVQRWVGLPLYPPSGAERTRNGVTTVYASWNGATELRGWRVVSVSSGAKRVVAQKHKTGFETQIRVKRSGRFEVEALNAAGRVIGTSKPF